MRLDRDRSSRSRGLSGTVLFVIGLCGIFILFWQAVMPARCDLQTGNKACDQKCRQLRYPAGELVPKMKHEVCVCWSYHVEPTACFLLRRKD